MSDLSTVPRTITIQVLLFAQIKNRLGQPPFLLSQESMGGQPPFLLSQEGMGGQPEISVSLPTGATGGDLIRALSQIDPGLAPLVAVSRLAVGQEYVSWNHPLQEGDEVAVIPPVSGG